VYNLHVQAIRAKGDFMASASLPSTLGELKRSGYTPITVKEEMRRNLIKKLRSGEAVFPGILGYDETVIPQVQNAILARHDFLLLGLRGQAKTRLVRSLVHLLDDYIPVVQGSHINDDPLNPVSKHARDLVENMGDETPVDWLPRERRYQEKLATPDVTIADLIGDVDPIKAMSRKLDFSDEEVIHYGIIPRSNRGIFAINELPDLQPRIQVGLLNIMEEKDLQIRGFPIRIPLDLCIVYTANPEDYTNRGNIITPLKDRIDAQIITHYPESLEEATAITRQEAWTDREATPEGVRVAIPELFRELVELVAFQARKSEYVDRNSGVSARMPITLLETLVAAAERRALAQGDSHTTLRIADLFASVTAVTGKVELVYKGEQEGPQNVAQFLVGRAIKEAFNKRFIPNYKPGREQKYGFPHFQQIIGWFEEDDKVLDIRDDMTEKEYQAALTSIDGLSAIVEEQWKDAGAHERHALTEFLIEGLHQNYLITKMVAGRKAVYTDTVSHMMGQMDED
jgi:magnesium chelatase subunit I